VQVKTGRLPIIYTPPSWWSACTGNSTAFGHTPVWVPDISGSGSPLLPAGWTTWSLWQYSGSGTVNGISGTTDLDQANPASLALLNPGTRKQADGTRWTCSCCGPCRPLDSRSASPRVVSRLGCP
jgi:GH25 family lysozyme M1 (1,4-beta-N-acetylmuramidase)